MVDRAFLQHAPYIIATMVFALHLLGFVIEKYVSGEVSLAVWLLISAVDVFFGFKCGRFIVQMGAKAYQDELTELPNRGFFNLKIAEELDTLNGTRCLSVLMIDLDDFKRVNDSYGHTVGDRVLRETAHIFSHVKREQDVALRWGGEEFVIILPNTNAEGASALGERVRRAVEQHQFAEIPAQLTVSIGVATVHNKIDVDSFVNLADTALYQAKSIKNSVICALPDVILKKHECRAN